MLAAAAAIVGLAAFYVGVRVERPSSQTTAPDAGPEAVAPVPRDAGAAPAAAAAAVSADAGVVMPKAPQGWPPPCWTGAGAIVYRDASGTPTIVSHPNKVPLRSRKTARCSW
jgi:hypothetical protein